MKISPSILSANFAWLRDDVLTVKDSDYLHVDVMDGHFVPNITFGLPIVKDLKSSVDIPLDVHLMITEPEKYIERFCKAGADIVTFHIEATNCPDKCIELIKENGAVPSISVKPNTPVEDIYQFLDKVGMVLVMTVEPGFGGQKFMAQHVSKIRQLAEWKKELGLEFDIEVDGGVTLDNVREVLDAGANVIVAGSAVFGKEDIAGAAKGFLDIFKEYE